MQKYSMKSSQEKDMFEKWQSAQVAAETCVRVLKEKFGVQEAFIIGSLAGQSPWHRHSDIDIAVSGLLPQQYMTVLSELWDLLPEGLDLDLISLEDAPEELVKRVHGEVKMPENLKEALKKDIADELLSLDRIVEKTKQLIAKLPAEPTFIEVNAAGKLIHDFYSSIERIFEMIAVRLGPGLPAGSSWHTLLLRSMESGVENLRPAIMDHSLTTQLAECLRFRHLFRHTYGFDLEWEKVRPLLEKLERMMLQFRLQINQFILALK